jgi:hypothetical protein
MQQHDDDFPCWVPKSGIKPSSCPSINFEEAIVIVVVLELVNLESNESRKFLAGLGEHSPALI